MFASIILTGGDSSRIGENKSLLDFNGKNLIELIIDKLKSISQEVYVVTQNKSEYEFLKDVQIIEDYPLENTDSNQLSTIPILSFLNQEKPKNILNAIYTGLNESKYNDNFICACDMPSLNIDLINYLYSFQNQYDSIVPVINYKPMTLHTFYNKSSIEPIKNSIDKGNKVVRKVFRDLNTKYINEELMKTKDPDLKSFFHIKTRLDYILSQTDY
jgi:molybdopterin-guanine dinucleotide biosynthesis protein A